MTPATRLTSHLFAFCWCLASTSVMAQVVGQNPAAAAAGPLQVVIEREPLVLKSPESYKVSLHLDPIKTVDVAAQVDGVVGSILSKMGEPIQAQAEVVRLDSRDRKLELDRAKAALEAARIQQKGAKEGVEKELADANVEVAQIDAELAQYRFDQAVVRAPFNGIVQQVHVVEGQFVRAGEPLATIIDSTQLQVQIPVDRGTSKVGETLQIQVEKSTTPATVQAVLPLTAAFEPLRDLFESIATAIAVVENDGGQFQPGQTVYASMIPRLPVAEVPNAAIGNSDDGSRRLQVIRDGFVRNVTVELLGAIGEERTVITGRFMPGDEMIVRASEELLDGTQVVPRAQLEASAGPAAPGTSGGTRSSGGNVPVPGGF